MNRSSHWSFLCYGAAALIVLASVFYAFASAHAAMYDTSDGCPVGSYHDFIYIMGTAFDVCTPYVSCTSLGAGWSGYEPNCVYTPTCTTVSCTSSANSCGMTSTGTQQVCSDGSGTACTATTPSNALCPASPPPPTCTGLGYTGGTYPACSNSCADLGQSGTWPSCYTPRSCTVSNSCGMTATGVTIDAAGDCSATAPSNSLCPATPAPYAQGTYVPPYSQSSYYSQGSYAPVSTCGTGVAPAIAAAPTIVKSGAASAISWSATGVPAGTACRITGANIGGAGVNTVVSAAADSSCRVASGSKSPAITAQTTFTITCGSASASVIVNIVPAYKEF